MFMSILNRTKEFSEVKIGLRRYQYMNKKPWPYRSSHYGTEGSGSFYWVTYEKMHQYRGGAEHPRIYSKKVWISGKDPEFDTEPKVRTNRQGNEVYGIAVTYQNPVSGFEAERDGTEYSVGEKTVEVTNVIPIPRGADNIRISKEPPRRG